MSGQVIGSNPIGIDLGSDALVALALHPDTGLGLAAAAGSEAVAVTGAALFDLIRQLDRDHRPRWVWWSRSTADVLVEAGVVVDRCWDVLTAQRLLDGRWRMTVGQAWARLGDLDPDTVPTMGQMDLLAAAEEGGDPEDPVRPDGHLRPEWTSGGWHDSPDRLARWATLTLKAAERQHELIEAATRTPDDPAGAVDNAAAGAVDNAAAGTTSGRTDHRRMLSTAHAESMAEFLCAELAFHGLPVDETEALRIIADSAGPRPETYADEEAAMARRDAEVTRLLDPPNSVNLRNPAEVKAMLSRTGLDLPDTRAWRLEKLRDTDPLIDALLIWRKAERIATTYGYTWFDENVSGGRLRGEWSSSDGAAGRMTASAGLHNLPAPMRPAVAAEPGHAFVRADLGQIEPRVLAAVSGDRVLISATEADDLYLPVAQRLGVERDVAKVAVLGAMYGATTGESAGALRGLERNYPVAMTLLADAAEQGKLGQDIFTIGGRRVRMGGGSSPDGDLDRAIAAAAARGRYARNALIQGAAAEFFKVWAVIVRRRVRDAGARVVLCLHDELLVHAPADRADDVAGLVADAVTEAAYYWSPEPDVRFLADVSIVQRWSEAKG